MLLIVPHYAGAQENEQPVTLKPVEVVGEKVDLFSGKVPQERINELQPVDIGDLLKKDVAGLDAIRKTGVALDPVLRGMSKDRLNVLIDGSFLHGACANRMDPPTMHISPYQVEDVFVTKGPFDVTLGPGALGGVINVNMRQPGYYENAEFHPEVRAGYDSVSHGLKSGVTLEGGHAPFAYNLSYDYKDFDGYKDGKGNKVRAGFEQTNFTAGLNYFLSKDTTIGVDYTGQRARDVFYPTLPMDSPKDDMNSVSLSMDAKNLEGIVKRVEARLYSTSVDHEMTNALKFDYADTDPLMHMDAPSESATYGGKIKTSLALLDGTEFGIDYYNRWWDITVKRRTLAGMSMPDIKAIPETTIADTGVFFQPSKKFGSATLTAGARVDFVQAKADAVGPAEQGYFDTYYGAGTAANLDKSETNAGGFLKGVWAMTDTVDVYAAAGRGVRTADPRERFRVLMPIHGMKWDIGNPNLEPEKSLEYEVGSKARFGTFFYNFSLFANNVKDYITQFNTGLTFDPDGAGPMPAQPVMGYKNVDGQLYGGELAMGVQATESISLLASASYTRGENETESKPLPEVMPLQGKAGVRYDAVSGKFWGEIMGNAAARQHRYDPVVDSGKTAGYATADVRMGWKPKERVLLTAGVENLFDRYYTAATSKNFSFNQDGYKTSDRIPEPGRNVYLNLTVDF